MSKKFYYLTLVFLIIIAFNLLVGKAKHTAQNCTICLQPLSDDFLVDPWGNKFHSIHKDEGIFCNSCSRIISQNITKGGYRYTDGRYLCSLCQISIVENDSTIHNAFRSVVSQMKSVGMQNIPVNIPIQLINLNDLNAKRTGIAHGDLKGITYKYYNENNHLQYNIFILFGLPKIEFEAVLAHELFHIWLYQNKNPLRIGLVEGFCNLGSFLIYENDNTHFSQIHLQAMEKDQDSLYGANYRMLKKELKKYGWKKFLKDLILIN